MGRTWRQIAATMSVSVVEFANSLPKERVSQWSDRVKRGWNIIWHVLDLSDLQHMEAEECDVCFEYNSPRMVTDLTILGGAVEAEWLTYRRLSNSDPWISRDFDMEAVLKSLEAGTGLSAGPMTDIPLMKHLCQCGWFAKDSFFPRAEDVCRDYISILGDNYDMMRIQSPPPDRKDLFWRFTE